MPLNKITTTVGLNIGKVTTQGVKLMFWDLGGQEELQSLWDKYFSDCHGVIFIVDSADPDRLLESKRAFDQVLRFSIFQWSWQSVCKKQDKRQVIQLKILKGY
jgi:ADP-ribosylation factor related protein 1